jgi:hypothetical protein
MKRMIILLAISLIFGPAAMAQMANAGKEMQFYLMAGMKSFAPKYFNSTTSVAPSIVPTIGGGALWQVNRLQFGAEFSYLDGKKDTEAFGSILTGINANILAGYRWDLSEKMRLSVQSGFGYSLHHLAVTDNTYSGTAQLNATIYHNMVISVPVSVMLQRVSATGLFTGLRVGYNVAIGHNHWRYLEGSSSEEYMSDADGLYFQLVFGGLLSLNDRKP